MPVVAVLRLTCQTLRPITLVLDNLLPGKRLYLLSTGTGLAPFLSLTRDPEIYEGYEKVILAHGVRYLSDLAYYERLTAELAEDEFLGELARGKLIYYPTVTREPYRNRGRISDLIRSGKFFEDIGQPPFNRGGGPHHALWQPPACWASCARCSKTSAGLRAIWASPGSL